MPRRRRPFRTLSLQAWLRRGTRPRRLVRAVALVTAVSVLVPASAFAVVLGSYLFLPLPAALPDEHATEASQISRVYAVDGTPIGEFRTAAQAIPIEADQIPETIRKAVLAAEDHDFFSHAGVDFEAVARALLANVTRGRIVQGGSTLTQQLVKNLYFEEKERRDRSPLRKAQEAIFAAQLERELSKEEILARYLNTVYLGDSAFGVEAAARSYFRKGAKDLTLAEAALLAQAIPAPSLYSPRANPEGAEERRLRVLDQMVQYGFATPEEAAAAKLEQLTIHPATGVESKYPYFMDYLSVYLFEVQGYSQKEILQGGLRIETTLDPELQDEAQEVIASTLDLPDDPQAALVSVEPTTGFVRALVGGRDRTASQVNAAIGRGGTGRQAGSSFKPFVLARALEAGVKPEKTYSGPSCIDLPGGYRPCNYGKDGYGTLTIRSATHQSVNTVYAQLILDVGVKETAEVAQRLGITTLDPEKGQYGAALALGAAEVTPLDMASAFSVFAARGIRAEPTPVLKITRPDGSVLEDNTEPDRDRVMNEGVADTMNDILQGVITSGTAKGKDIGRPAAGKTGTEDDNSDAWFVGYTPTLSTAVWMGYFEGQIPMKNVHGRAVTGGSFPAAMWQSFMKSALKDVPKTEFTEPAPLDSLRERALRQQRGGYDLGDRRYPRGFGAEDPYYVPPPQPEASAPPDGGETDETTTTTSPSSTTTTTTPSPTPTTLPSVTTTTSGGLF